MSISSYGVLDRQTTNTERWVTFAALFLFGFTASCNLFKASPVMTVIGGDLGLDAGGRSIPSLLWLWLSLALWLCVKSA